MNQKTQSSAHPDAEILNGFAEQALGASERDEVLGHLAICARCREILALAGAAVEAERVAALPRRKPWFASWRLTLAPALALAGVAAVAVFVYVRHKDQAAEMARVEAPVPPAAEAGTGVPSMNGPDERLKGARQVVNKTSAPPASASYGSAGLMAQGSFAAQAPPPVKMAEAEDKAAAPPPVAEAVATDRAPVASIASKDRNEAEHAIATQKTLAMASAVQAQPAAGNAAPAPASTYRAMTLAPSAEQRLHVPMRKAAALPGGLGMVSSAVIGQWTVAIDTAGNVFLSRDAGQRWVEVARQWTGRAVRVESKTEAGAAKSIFELSNDQNQIWTSTDAAIWTPR